MADHIVINTRHLTRYLPINGSLHRHRQQRRHRQHTFLPKMGTLIFKRTRSPLHFSKTRSWPCFSERAANGQKQMRRTICEKTDAFCGSHLQNPVWCFVVFSFFQTFMFGSHQKGPKTPIFRNRASRTSQRSTFRPIATEKRAQKEPTQGFAGVRRTRATRTLYEHLEVTHVAGVCAGGASVVLRDRLHPRKQVGGGFAGHAQVQGLATCRNQHLPWTWDQCERGFYC